MQVHTPFLCLLPCSTMHILNVPSLSSFWFLQTPSSCCSSVEHCIWAYALGGCVCILHVPLCIAKDVIRMDRIATDGACQPSVHNLLVYILSVL